jgi:tetratricopeptide (TPR) repeat protein/TolB-like protein
MTLSVFPSAVLALAALGIGATPARAQCPDGSPPPCRAGGGTAVRRANPPLDDRTWIVLPFENVARVADIDWLKDASVNLLYLDMSKWRDIRVIDDERVSDLMRESSASSAQPLGLEAGITVARRAGAGKLVMGDLLKVGSRTQVVAKVYDVRTRTRLRSVRQETNNPDSLMVIFGRLARAILAADPPAGTSLGTVGTTSLEAYREYVSGVNALNRVDLDSAEARFIRAIALDSSFALAHYKASVTYGWLNPNDPRRVRHAELANRLSGGLPPRERQLILGQSQTSASRWGEACQTYAALVRADSNDVEAWYNLGECNYHDQAVALAGGDSTRPQFRGSWNLAMQAFQRALAIDPTYHLAYSHIPDILLVEQRGGCLNRDVLGTGCQPSEQYVATLMREGDSLVTRPIAALNQAAVTAQSIEATRQNVWRTNLRKTRESAQAWVHAGPDEPRAHLALARALIRSGAPDEAAREFALATRATTGAAETARMITDRIELLFKTDSTAAIGRLADSLEQRAAGTPNDFRTFVPLLLGRWRNMNSLFGASFQGPPGMRAFLAEAFKTMQGVAPDNLIALERGLDSAFVAGGAPPAQRRGTRTTFQLTTAPWTLDVPRPEPLNDADTTLADPRFQMIAFAIRGDSARLRGALARLDSILQALPMEMPNASGFQYSAEAHLMLGDTARALARLMAFEARLPYLNPMAQHMNNFGNLTVAMLSWNRTFLRLADLAAARGDAPTAIRNYRRVIGLWSGADAAFQPQVTRARAALARLGG